MLKSLFIGSTLFALSTVACFGQATPIEFVYKTVDTTQLKMKLYYPADYKKGQKLPAIVLFFGGSWRTGSTKQFEQQAMHFAAEGMIAATADYRVQSRQHSTPFQSVSDAKSAIRYLKIKAKELGIDTNKLAAGGGSAGGHLAAAADLTRLDEPGENLRINSRPKALILFNPVFNNGPGEFGYDVVGERYPEFSPYHNIRAGAAPTIAFFGTKDKFVPVATAKLYQIAMQAKGNRCEIVFYDDQPHGFFNYKDGTDNKYYKLTMAEADHFLQSLGYIK